MADEGMFPTTRPSVIGGLLGDDPRQRARSRDAVAAAYWKPVYKYTRVRWGKSPAEAEDLTQAFFAHAFDKDTFAGFDPSRARFRTFLRTCLDRLVIDEHRRASAQRRGGGAPALDFAVAEAELADVTGADRDPEAVFDAEWLRHLMGVAVARLRDHLIGRGKPIHAELFTRFHLHDEPPSYDVVAAELAIKVTDVTNWLHQARRDFRRIALDLLREITASEAEFAEEARAVFGIEIAAGEAGAGRAASRPRPERK